MSDYDEEPMQYLSLIILCIHAEPMGILVDCGDTDHTVAVGDKQVDVNVFYTTYHTSVQEAQGFVTYELPAHNEEINAKRVDLAKACNFVILHDALQDRAQQIKESFGLGDKPHIIGKAEWMQFVLDCAPFDLDVDEWDIYTEWVNRSGILDKLVDLT